MPVKEMPNLAILLCLYHGRCFLSEQLDSLGRQTHTHWELHVSNDGPPEEVEDLLIPWSKTVAPRRMLAYTGPRVGFTANFLSLTCREEIQADYYAWCDQDDIWEADKLERALRVLQTVPAEMPALYCARTRLVDADNREIGFSPLFTRPPCFANALTQNIAGGNTMVFNNAARQLFIEAGPNVPAVTHDWWAYLLLTGCGGQVFYDPEPALRYRQHDSNQIGMNSGWYPRLVRLKFLWQGRFKCWNDGNIAALHRMEKRLTAENRNILERFVQARKKPLFSRLLALKRSGICRQTLAGNLALIVAAIFGKL